MFGSEFLFSPIALHVTGTIGIPTPSVSSKLCFRHFSILLSCCFLTSFLHPTTHREEEERKREKEKGEKRLALVFYSLLLFPFNQKRIEGRRGSLPLSFRPFQLVLRDLSSSPSPYRTSNSSHTFPNVHTPPAHGYVVQTVAASAKKGGGVFPPCIRCQHGSSVGGLGRTESGAIN